MDEGSRVTARAVTAKTSAQVFCFSDIKDLPFYVFHQINTGGGGEGGNNVFDMGFHWKFLTYT